MNELTKALDNLENAVQKYSLEAIERLGGVFKRFGVTFCRGGASDTHFKERKWLVTYSVSDYTTIQQTLSPFGVHATDGTLEVVFGLPGEAAKDDSSVDSDSRSNWGDRGFITREGERRGEAQTCRAVTHLFAQLIQQTLSDCRFILTQYDIVENNPHQERQNFVWFPNTITLGWRLSWTNSDATSSQTG